MRVSASLFVSEGVEGIQHALICRIATQGSLRCTLPIILTVLVRKQEAKFLSFISMNFYRLAMHWRVLADES